MRVSSKIAEAVEGCHSAREKIAPLQRGHRNAKRREKYGHAQYAEFLGQMHDARQRGDWLTVGALQRQFWRRHNKDAAKRAEVAIWESELQRKMAYVAGY